jgi:threonine dehydratase
VVDLESIRAARERLGGAVRLTPVMSARPAHRDLDAAVVLKLECLQVTGSFKPRGAVNRLLTLPAGAAARGLVTASGGNHGLGVAYAGWRARVPVTVYLPRSTPPAKAERLGGWGARVVWEGDVWDDANAAALAAAAREGLAYVHPFADEAVIAGQGTVGLEILEQAPEVRTVVVAIGGGGLIAGVAVAVKALRPDVRVIGVEPTGAPTLHESVRAGRLVELAAITTAAGTLAPRRSAQVNLDLVRRHVDGIVLVDDAEMREAARWLWREYTVGTELSGAATVAAVLAGRIDAAGPVCALVCGAGADGVEG